MNARWMMIAVGIGAVLMVSGCAGAEQRPGSEPSADPTQSIQTAKADAQQADRALLQLLPSDLVTGVDQYPTGSLVSCSDNAKQWAGSTIFSVAESTSREAMLDEIESAAREHGMEVDRQRAVDGSTRLKVLRDRGASMFVGTYGKGPKLEISSFSHCFSVPDGFIPDPSY